MYRPDTGPARLRILREPLDHEGSKPSKMRLQRRLDPLKCPLMSKGLLRPFQQQLCDLCFGLWACSPLGSAFNENAHPLSRPPNSQESGSPSAGCTLVAPEWSLWIQGQAECLQTDYRSCAILAKVEQGSLPIHVYKSCIEDQARPRTQRPTRADHVTCSHVLRGLCFSESVNVSQIAWMRLTARNSRGVLRR